MLDGLVVYVVDVGGLLFWDGLYGFGVVGIEGVV